MFIRDTLNNRTKINDNKITISGAVNLSPQGLQAIAKCIETYKKNYKIKVLIGAPQHIAADDISFVEQLKKLAPKGWELVNAETMPVWLNTILSSKLLISGRFHHSIAAYCLGTPFVAMTSNTEKVNALMEIFKEEQPLNMAAENLNEQLLQQVEKTLAGKQKALDSPSLDLLCEMAMKNFDGLR